MRFGTDECAVDGSRDWAGGLLVGPREALLRRLILELATVRGFEKLVFDDQGDVNGSDIVVVEWRVGKKAKEASWPVYRAQILKASRKWSVVV